MKNVLFPRRRPLPRRSFLKAAGVSFALPFLDAMRPAFSADQVDATPYRMVAINIDLGFMQNRFFPADSGRNYGLSPYLQPLEDLRNEFTVFSGLHHPGTGGLHDADVCFLTAATHPTRPGFKNTLSLDQRVAQEVGHLTRFPSLSLRVGPGSKSLSFTADGVAIPAIERPSDVYRMLFMEGSQEQIRQTDSTIARWSKPDGPVRQRDSITSATVSARQMTSDCNNTSILFASWKSDLRCKRHGHIGRSLRSTFRSRRTIRLRAV